MENKTKSEIESLQKKLSQLFKHAYENRASISLLYEKGKTIEDRIHDICPDFNSLENFVELKEALTFIDQLHDSSTRRYHSSNKEQIYYYMRRLS